MITHDVDEAIFLADKIVLMTNGPNAMIAEIVQNSLPRERSRRDIMQLERLPNPKGDRVRLTMSGKFLPYKYYGNEQGLPEYGFKES